MNKNKIIAEFRRIKNLGFIKSTRKNNTGIGKTFEDCLGVRENNLKDPDFEGIEIKSQRQATSSYITLFTKCPSHPKRANSYLRETFGKPDNKFPKIKVLHTSMFGNRFNTYLGKYGFKLRAEIIEKKLMLEVKSLLGKELIAESIYWTFDDLKICIDRKLSSLFVVLADTKKIDNIEHFHFTKAIVYQNLQFDKFLKAINGGAIMFDIRIGAYKTRGRKNFGKTHDHGSGFRIKRDKLPMLFEQVFEVD